MNLYEKIKLQPVRSEPDVWVSRLVIFENIDQPNNPKIIRDIRLTRGLNIIQAEEQEIDSPFIAITGHSAGKTTFCRFLRYVLGEKTFGTKTAVEFIREALPEGYLAAEIHVRGQKWAVRRPFASGRMTYIMQGATVEDILHDRTGKITQEEYTKKIGLEKLLDNLETGTIVRTSENIEWGHILAWCTRDQEHRYQNIYEWRSSRSQSGSPSFRRSKEGPLFMMRTVLGLYLKEELKDEERLAELQRKKELLTKALEEKSREPQFRVKLYDLQLRKQLKAFLPSEEDIDSRSFQSRTLFPEDLERLTMRAVAQIKAVVGELERERNELQMKIDDLGAEIREQQHKLAELDGLFKMKTAASKELDHTSSQRQENIEKIQKFRDKSCPFGGVLIQECSYVQDLQRIFNLSEFKDAEAMNQAAAKRIEAGKKITETKNRIHADIVELQQELQRTSSKRDTLTTEISRKQYEQRDLQRTRDELLAWTRHLEKPDTHDELLGLRQKFEATETEISEIEQKLTNLIGQHNENRECLAAIFSETVRSVLSSDEYNGVVSIDNRELAFSITHGPAMIGEAVETLSVILADLASLVYYTVSPNVHLPGFLIHDSPREADLGLRIYRALIRFAASLQTHFGGADNCPFQYILTTTTAPPDELRGDEYVRLRLNTSTPEGLLLGRNVAVTHSKAGGRLQF